MPIGKNALKRVTNNGYSGVKASAPDMENSEIIEEKTVEKAKKPAVKKPTEKAKSAPEAKKTEKKAEPKISDAKAAPKKNTAPKVERPKQEKPKIEKIEETPAPESKESATSHPDGFVKISFGMDMPTYLL